MEGSVHGIGIPMREFRLPHPTTGRPRPVGCQRVGETGRIEVQTELFCFGKIDPTGKVRSIKLIAFDLPAIGIGVNGMDIEPFARDIKILPSSIGCLRTSRTSFLNSVNSSRNKIPLCARIMAIADVFDAVSEKRCYRDAMPLNQCFEIIENGRGQDFDPLLVDIFLSMKDKIVDNYNAL